MSILYQDELYGNFKIEGILEELVNTEPFQRLKRIHQGGAIIVARPDLNQTRYDHSIGVMKLIQVLEGGLADQIMGLLHDVSHTAFSHLIDYVLDLSEENYHEHIFSEVIQHPEILRIIKKYGFNIEQFLTPEKFTVVDYPLPGLCADRVDYTLRDLMKLEQITKAEVSWFLKGLAIINNRIVVTEVKYAQWFKGKYTFLVEEYFNGRENKSANKFMAAITKELYNKGDLTLADFNKDDFQVSKKIERVLKIDLHKSYQNWLSAQDTHVVFKTKPREVDPDVIIENQLLRLSQLNNK
ncbi:HD domain-containing protein [Sphingobacterium sp. Mn56C]|uniref:HD domain-containing protein n=1 Tax=Sphingobacterium sp. Mn56C TaxID=3395261 RepID=UPI003BD64184